MLAGMCSIPQVHTRDTTVPDAVIASSGILAIGSLIGYGISAYANYQEQTRIEQAVSRLSERINDIERRHGYLLYNTREGSHRASGYDAICRCAQVEASFMDEKDALKSNLTCLDDAYSNVYHCENINQHPSLYHEFQRLQNRYRDMRDKLCTLLAYFRSHAAQLQAHDMVYRIDHLVRYEQANPEYIISHFTRRDIGWPRVKAVEDLQQYRTRLERLYTNLCDEMHHHYDTQHDQHLLERMHNIMMRINAACQQLSTSPVYDTERERYRYDQQHQQVMQAYQSYIDAERERKDAEDRNRKATERNTRMLERYKCEAERAQDLYHKLIQCGYQELPRIYRELDALRDRINRIDRKDIVTDADMHDLRRRVDTIMSRIPHDADQTLSISFNINL